MKTDLFAAEYIFPGHPDKICDAVADALVAEAVRREKRALCGVEVAVHRSTVFVTGRIACKGAESIPVREIVLDCFRSAGYSEEWGPAPEDLRVETELCLGPMSPGESEFRGVSDDQSIVTGYAIDIPGTNYLPPEHWLAWRLSNRLQSLRANHPELQLGPDGKVAVIYDAASNTLERLSTSLQQKVAADEIAVHRAVREATSRELEDCAAAIPAFVSKPPDSIHVNGAGNFEVGGTEGDNGLSGKKLVVDAYGPRVPIGGGALSGKDFFKADRAGALLARRVAKAIVLTGAARESTATMAIFPGDTKFRLLSITPDAVAVNRWASLFDLSLESAGERYSTQCDLITLARYGHFTDSARPWEQLSI